MPQIPGFLDPNPVIKTPKGIITRVTENVLGVKLPDRYEKFNPRTGKNESVPAPTGKPVPYLPPLPPLEKIKTPATPVSIAPPPILSKPVVPVIAPKISINTNSPYGAGTQAIVNKINTTPTAAANNAINVAAGYSAGAQALVNKAMAVANPTIALNSALNAGNSYSAPKLPGLSPMPTPMMPTPMPAAPMPAAAALVIGGAKAAGLKGFGDWKFNSWLPWLVVGGAVIWLYRRK